MAGVSRVVESVPLTLRSHTSLRRGKLKLHDEALHTTRLIGAGWTWDCTCGFNGGWHSTREQAAEFARAHKRNAHGQR